jgi:monoamine oxidase
MSSDFDVIVIGAGFAGAAAARECATRGQRTLVLEWRDRIGGRTWTTQLANGELIESGGTFVHWFQPHTWSEISRYGLVGEVIDAAEELEWALAPRDGRLAWCPMEEHAARERALMERVFEGSEAIMPRPYDPAYMSDEVARIDQLSIRDRLDQLALSDDDDAYLTALFGIEAQEAVEEAGFAGMMRWWAAAGHHYDLLEATVFGYKMRNGIVSVLGAMLADGGADVRLSHPVAKVAQDADGVAVTCADGQTFTGRAAVVATPTGVWPHLDFSPPLSPERVEAAQAGMQVPRGTKAHVVLKGESRRMYVQPRADHAVGFMWTTSVRDDGTQVVVVFGSPHLHDATDREAVAAAVRDLLPHVEVLEVVGANYDHTEEFARGGWPLLKRGDLTRLAPHERLAQPEGRIAFATADISTLWSSFIDGAIESGLRAAREVRELLDPVGTSV